MLILMSYLGATKEIYIFEKKGLNLTAATWQSSSLTFIPGFSVNFSFSRFITMMQIRHILKKIITFKSSLK